MQRGLLTALLALCACGRLDFAAQPGRDASPIDDDAGSADAPPPDALPCVPVGHDDDGDGLDDACDLCPQLADASEQMDVDGDHIGNACDIAATVDTRTLFDPFTQVTGKWVFYSGTVMNDSYVMASLAGGAGADLTEPPERATYEINGVIVATNYPSQISMSMSEAGTEERYYCELYDTGTSHKLQLTQTLDGINYLVIAEATIATRMMPGPFRLMLDHTPPTTTCIASVGGQGYQANGVNPAAVTPNLFSFNVFQNSVEVRSFVRVSRP